MDRYGGNRRQKIYRCCSNYALPKVIMDNELEDLWRKENSLASLKLGITDVFENLTFFLDVK